MACKNIKFVLNFFLLFRNYLAYVAHLGISNTFTLFAVCVCVCVQFPKWYLQLRIKSSENRKRWVCKNKTVRMKIEREKERNKKENKLKQIEDVRTPYVISN